MNKNKIKEILEELYLIDESLKEHQVELEKIIEKLLAAKPKVEINEQFKQELRRELLARIEEIKGQESVSPNKFMNIFSFNRLSYALVGGALAIALVIGGVYYANQKGFLIGQPELGLAIKFSTTALSDEAFGSLKSETQEVSTDEQLGIGNATGVGSAVAPGKGGGGGFGIVPPDITQYRYLYKGEDLVLEQDKVEVLKREKGIASSEITNLIRNMNFGMVDLSSFANARLDSVNFIDDKDFGYAVFVNFSEGTISINYNMWGWQEVLGMCFDPGCVRPEPLKESDIPSEEKIIEVADNFIGDYGIKIDNYGQPETRRDQLIEQFRGAGGAYGPENIQVIYPLMINGQYVYDQWGNEVGLNVDVNLRAMRVTGLYNLTTQNYQSSMYQAETDVNKILEAAEKGGINQQVFDSVSKTISVEIGTPSLAYMKVWKHEQGQSDEFLTPALVFPIDNSQQEGTYKRERIIIPLAKDLLETFEDRN